MSSQYPIEPTLGRAGEGRREIRSLRDENSAGVLERPENLAVDVVWVGFAASLQQHNRPLQELKSREHVLDDPQCEVRVRDDFQIQAHPSVFRFPTITLAGVFGRECRAKVTL